MPAASAYPKIRLSHGSFEKGLALSALANVGRSLAILYQDRAEPVFML
jgi:hypothetical protein